MIKIEDFSFCYNGAVTPALDSITLIIPDEEFVVIAGPSGSGKSSLCRCLNGLIPHFYGGTVSGSVEVQGLDVLRHSTREMARKVGLILQDPENQIVTTDVEREIAFGLENLAFPRDLIARRIEESLDTLGICHLRHSQIQMLSGGEKQKLAIAAVLAMHPGILVLDEPTSELDPQSAEEVLSIIKRLNDELGITIILIEHRLERVLPLADRLVVLDRSKLVVNCHPRNILPDYYDRIVSTGIGMPPVVKLARQIMDRVPMPLEGTPLTVRDARRMLRESVFSVSSLQVEPPLKKRGQLIIEAEKLTCAYPEGPPVIKNLSLEIYRGEFIAIMGRNASGKTTLIKHFNGILKPVRGTVKIDGLDTRKITVAALAEKIGFVSQNPNDHLFADTVEEELSFTLRHLGFKPGERLSRIKRVTAQFKLNDYLRRYPRSLSGGEKQRVALASVMVAQPEVLILDEPTRGMDSTLKTELMRFLADYAQQGNTVILVTHDVESAAEMADRVILMSEGEIIVDDTTRKALSQALLFSPQINRLVQAFTEQGVSPDILTIEELLRILK